MSRIGDAGSWLARTVIGSPAAAATRFQAADRILRTPLPLSRRIGFVSLAGGSGLSTTAGAVASLLAARRTGMVLGVDAAGGLAGLVARAGGVPEPDTAQSADHAARRRTARSAEEARSGLDRTATGLYLLDLARQQHAVSVDIWRSSVRPIARFYDLVLTDWGVRPSAADLADVAAESHVVVLVARSDRPSASAAAATVAALRTQGVAAESLLVLADVARSPDRMQQPLRRALRAPLYEVGYASARARATVVDSRRLSARTRRQHIWLAAGVLAAAVRSQSGRAVGDTRRAAA